ncbi:hypothetical protein [Streptomyces sp. NPDC058964]|uniref:hypothetical protein n=1 Tax=Streptomyces sp. NPDC058964 TaxID=3346681 RepID=UPI003673B157
MFIASQDTRPVRLDRGMAEAVGQVAGAAAGEAAAEPHAACGADRSVERGFDRPPVVAVGFGRHHLGKRDFLAAADVPGCRKADRYPVVIAGSAPKGSC